jgi:hypothetical protein
MNYVKLSAEEAQKYRDDAESVLRINSIKYRIQSLSGKIPENFRKLETLLGVPFPQRDYDVVAEQIRITHMRPTEFVNGATHDVSDANYLEMLEAAWKRLNSQNNELVHQIGNINWEKNMGPLTKV